MSKGSKIGDLLRGGKGAKQRVNVYVGKETYLAFQQVCEFNSLSVSETVDALMADFVKDHGPEARVRPLSSLPKPLEGEE